MGRTPHRALLSLLAGLMASNPVGAAGYSLNDAVNEVSGRERGQVLRAETRRQESREEHQVRILTDDGRVRQFRIDASTGAVLPPPGGEGR